jgi:hypothetical protein
MTILKATGHTANFLDLPLRLRKKIYKLALHVRRPIEGLHGVLREGTTPSVVAVNTLETSSVRHVKNPPLLQVQNSQVHREAGAVYYRQRPFVFLLDASRSDLTKDITAWARFAVRANARQLRRIYVFIARRDTVHSYTTGRYTPVSYDYSFVVKFSPATGLSAQASYFEYDLTDAMADWTPLDIDLEEYTAGFTPFIQNGMEGQALIGFFHANPKGLRAACMGEPEKCITDAIGRREVEIVPCDEDDPEAIRRNF